MTFAYLIDPLCTSLQFRGERLSRVREVCQRLGLTGSGQLREHSVLADSRHRAILCKQAKVGATTWGNILVASHTEGQDAGAANWTIQGVHRRAEKLFDGWHVLNADSAPAVGEAKDNALTLAVAEAVNNNGYFLFSFVRHPFERYFKL